MRAIIAGGGTTGHITPGIAIAETILSHEKDSDILFIGRDGGDENGIIKQRGFQLKTLKISGFSRKLTIKNIANAFHATAALATAGKIIRDFAPDVVIGTGGYVCWPVLKAAQIARIPTILHESNVVPGLATRMLAPKCTRVLLNFPGSEKELKRADNAVIVGNPILSGLLRETREGARRRLGISNSEFMILSFGGSGGAEILNKHAVALMQNYCTRVGRIRHLHATGRKYYAAIKSAYPTLVSGRGGCMIYPFIEDMSTYMRAADIVICRCGAMTLSELASAGAVPILIPSPNVTDNHQYKNGKLFVDRGAALMIEESELNDRTLIDAVRYLENNPHLRAKMQSRLREFSTENSRELIYDNLREILAK